MKKLVYDGIIRNNISENGHTRRSRRARERETLHASADEFFCDECFGNMPQSLGKMGIGSVYCAGENGNRVDILWQMEGSASLRNIQK